MSESSDCIISLPAFSVVSVPDFGHSIRCIVVSHYCFNLHSLMTYNVEHLICHLCIFGEVSVKVFGPFFNWVVCFLIVEYFEFFVYFGKQSFIRFVLWKCFFPVCGLSSYSLDTVSYEQKFLILIKSSLFIS